jgi:uncharacterized protein YjbI with pentapeptide repeats
MQTYKPINNLVKEKISKYIKEGIDISDIIKDYEIKDLDLSGAIIKNITRIQQDLSNMRFIRCIFGEEGKILNFSGSNFNGSNFSGAKFLCKVWFRSCDLRNVNFSYAYIPNVDFQYSDLRNINLCSTVIRFGGTEGLGCTFSKKTFEQLGKYWNLV